MRRKTILTVMIGLLLLFSGGQTAFAADPIQRMDVEYNTETPLTEDAEEFEEETEDDITYEEVTEVSYHNDETGYDAYIFDEADILTSPEEEELMEVMEELTYYGNVVFCSIAENYTTPSAMASDLYVQIFGANTHSGTLFLIDMEHRELYLHNAGNVKGDMSYAISSSKSNSIMDNVYKLASKGDYCGCAKKTFRQELTLLGGGKIAQPMRLASNIFLAITIALLLSYAVVKAFSKTPKPSEKELLAAIRTKQNLYDFKKVFTRQTREYSPQSSSSGGGGGGGGGGGHTSGGGHGF